MSSKDQNLSSNHTDIPNGKGLKIGLVTSEWNSEITFALESACLQTLEEHEVDSSDITKIYVPGTFELPLGAKMLLGKESLDVVICLGCVIKGETKHDEYISHAVATAIAQLNILSSKPIIFGVLTPNDMDQAIDRAGGKYGNKGVEAAQTALKMADLQKTLKKSNKSIGF